MSEFAPGAISGTSRAWKQHSDALPQAAPSQEQHQIDDTTKHNISSTITPGGIDNVSPISSLSNDCLKYYQILHGALAKSTDEEATERGYDRDSSLTEIFDALSRFRAWGGNIAAFQKGHLKSSLDARLKEAKGIRERILRILRDLKQSLETGSSFPIFEQLMKLTLHSFPYCFWLDSERKMAPRCFERFRR